MKCQRLAIANETMCVCEYSLIVLMVPLELLQAEQSPRVTEQATEHVTCWWSIVSECVVGSHAEDTVDSLRGLGLYK